MNWHLSYVAKGMWEKAITNTHRNVEILLMIWLPYINTANKAREIGWSQDCRIWYNRKLSGPSCSPCLVTYWFFLIFFFFLDLLKSSGANPDFFYLSLFRSHCPLVTYSKLFKNSKLILDWVSSLINTTICNLVKQPNSCSQLVHTYSW